MRIEYILVLLKGIGQIFRKKNHSKRFLDHCLNCQAKLESSYHFCPSCGQKTRDSKLTFPSLVGEFFASFFNLDNSLWHTLLGIWRPGYLPKEFMSGKRKKFLHPMRLFFIMLVLQFTLLASLINNEDIDKAYSDNIKSLSRSEVYDDFTALKDSLSDILIGCEIDSFESRLFANVKHSDRDSINYFSNKNNSNNQDSVDFNLKFLNVDLGRYPMLRKDIYLMPVDTLLKKYNVVGFQNKLVIQQYIRGLRDLSGALQFAVGNLIWGVISTTFILAFFMKFFYIRRQRYYVEHAVVLGYVSSFSFLVGSFLVITRLIDDQILTTKMVSIAAFIVLIYFFWTLKSYYSQGWFKTILKFGLISLSYLVILTVMMLIVFLISILVF